MRTRVYVSGPLTSSGNVLENVADAIDASQKLIRARFAPFCPHLSWYLDQAGEIPHATWMDVDLPWVEVADAVLRLCGESLGADIEVEHARAAGVPVFTTVAGLMCHFAEKSSKAA